MRLLAQMVMKNEADRYLQSCLEWLLPQVDGAAVYDDQSNDRSVEIAQALKVPVRVRDDSVPGFLQHEGRFRAAAWSYFEEVLQPEPGDWVLAIDADEFLVGDNPDSLRDVTTEAAQGAFAGVVLPVPEVFGWSDAGIPLVRKDGYWGEIMGPRLFAYRPGGVFQDNSMGCGSEPTYVANGPLSHLSRSLYLMHFGYADYQDQVTKHERYTTLIAHGHNNSHIQSILTQPTLVQWPGPIPPARAAALQNDGTAQ